MKPTHPEIDTLQSEEDPVEVYKREFKRKRFERDKQERKRRLRYEQLVFHSMYVVTFRCWHLPF